MITPAIEPEETPSEESLTNWANDSDRLESTEETPEAEPSPELLRLQTENAQLTRERDDRTLQVNAANTAVEQEREAQVLATQYAQTLISQGRTEEDANQIAELERRYWLLNKQFEQLQGSGDSDRLSYGKADVARRFNISEESLKPFTTVEQAELYASGTAGQDKRITALEQVQKNGNAPVQQYSVQGRTGGGAGSSAYAESLKNGEALPSSTEIDKLTAKFTQ